MPAVSEINYYIIDLLSAGNAAYFDNTLSGLFVAHNEPVNKIVTGITPSPTFFEQALAEKPDMIITHHGLFVKEGNPRCWPLSRSLWGLKEQLGRNNIALANYHLPLDYSMKLGNNLTLAKMFGLENLHPAVLRNGRPFGIIGTFSPPVTPEELMTRVNQIKPEGRQAILVEPFSQSNIESMFLCCGGGWRFFLDAIEQYNPDCFFTGENTEGVYYYAKEYSTYFLSAGHHDSEVPGMLELGTHLMEWCSDLEVKFLNFDNPF